LTLNQHSNPKQSLDLSQLSEIAGEKIMRNGRAKWYNKGINNLSMACSGLGAKRELARELEIREDGIDSLSDAAVLIDLPLVSLELIGLSTSSEVKTTLEQTKKDLL
jgi:hypothetical protein